MARPIKRLGPIIKERTQTYGRARERLEQNDTPQWLIDEKQESSTRLLTLRALTINSASIHSTANTFTQALYDLAGYSQYVGSLREEVDAIIREHGWTKEAIALIRKVDSCLLETQRLEGVLTSSVQRQVMKDVTLSDGTRIPKGTHLSIPTFVSTATVESATTVASSILSGSPN
ncbi:cytochrome P450 [Pisolithus sp. B1]|nr:cytochrome P450 [Pisolithus sp. B1]